ncbi:MAG: polyamine aminopropyltransferase [Archaeoglobaceae archaeon]
MEWFEETINDTLGLKVRVKQKLYQHSGIQHIEIYETELGKMLVIDHKVQLIEDFEASYHEMLVHVPMILHENPQKVLIIGGGDGGTAREVLKHDPQKVVMVEVDEQVVKASKRYMKIDNGALEDSRVDLLHENGIEYVKNSNERFNVLIVDGTDPTPVSEALFTQEFYKRCSQITDYFSIQSQSPLIQSKDFREVYHKTAVFGYRRVYLSNVPMYPGGIWSFILGSDKPIKNELEEIERRFQERKINTEYYDPAVHCAAFSLPVWVQGLLKS